MLGVKCEPAGSWSTWRTGEHDDGRDLTAQLTALVVDPQGQGMELQRQRRRLPGLHRHDHVGDDAGVEALPARERDQQIPAPIGPR